MNKELMKSDKIGFSTLKMFYENAQLFRKYQKDLKEGTLERKSYFDFGSAFHKLILQKDEFLKEYAVLPVFPEGKYADAVKTLVSTRTMYSNGEEDRTKDWLNNAIFTSELKCDADALYKKIWENEKDETYLKMFLKLVELENFKTLTQEEWDLLISMETSVLNSSYIYRFCIGIEPEFGIEVFTEKNLKWYSDLLEEPMELDSTLDRVVIDHNKKTIDILDLKSTKSKISKFTETIKEYDYDLQGYMYLQAIKYNYTELINLGYSVYYCILAVEKQNPSYCWLFGMSAETFVNNELKFVKIARNLLDSYSSGNWNKINGNDSSIIF